MLTQDPIGLAGGINLYSYAGNNPVSFSDAFGLCPESAGGDDKSDKYSDCPEGTSGYNAHQAAVGRGGAGNTAAGIYHSCMENTGCRLAGVAVVAYTGARLVQAAYTALMAAPVAATTIPILGSAEAKLEPLAQKFGTTTKDLVDRVLTTGQRFTDMANAGNVNVLMGRPDGGAGLVRVTLDPAEQRVISAGMMRASQVAQYIANGRLVAR